MTEQEAQQLRDRAYGDGYGAVGEVEVKPLRPPVVDTDRMTAYLTATQGTSFAVQFQQALQPSQFCLVIFVQSEDDASCGTTYNVKTPAEYAEFDEAFKIVQKYRGVGQF
jgi:hypothetical protein